MQGPFQDGMRVRVEWAADQSALECTIVKYNFESGDDLAIKWGNQLVHFWDGAEGVMTHIFSLEDVTIEILGSGG